MTDKLLISRCLLGELVTWKNTANKIDDDWLQDLNDRGLLVPVCPELEGGLTVPRSPVEQQLNGAFHNIDGEDKSSEFIKGAKCTLTLALKNNCRVALLKSKSPSCGNKEIYDGSFSGNLVKGAGITARYLTNEGVVVFNEYELQKLKDYYRFLAK